MIGQTISHYRITAELGRGGMGVVYQAEDTRLGRTVALKFLPPHLTTDPEARNRFVAEARAASALDHPNLCTLHDIGETDDGRLFLAMACYDGETLKDRLARGPLPIEETTTIARQVAAGLAAAHERGIVHRDVKPANVFLCRDGQVKLLDFGIALLADETRMTRPDQIVGTVQYMSPEQVRGDAVDARTDVWSLGTMIYEMLTGETAFPEGNAAATVYAILQQDTRPLSEARRDVPVVLAEIVERSLEKNAARRYASAAEQAAVLAEFGEDLAAGVRVERFTVLRRLRRRRSLIISAAVILIVLAGSVATLVTMQRARAIDAIAVLPFADLSGDAEHAHFADAMTDALITEVQQAVGHHLRVIGRTSVMRYRNGDTPLPDIAAELGVDALIEASVSRHGGLVKIAAKLLRARPERQIWAKTYERRPGDVAALHAEIAREIAELTLPDVDGDAKARLARREQRTVNAEAYDAFLLGKHWADRNAIRRALPYFEQAIAADSTYAPAWAWAAHCYIMPAHGWPVPEGTIETARRMAERAIELDPDYADAYFHLAHILWEHDWDMQGAQEAYDRAFALNPAHGLGHLSYAFYNAALGKLEVAVEAADRALALEPFNRLINESVWQTYASARRFDRAGEVLERCTELYDSYDNRENTGWIRYWQGDYDATIELWNAVKADLATEDHHRWPDLLFMLAAVHARKGDQERAGELWAEWRSHVDMETVRASGPAIMHAWLGDTDEAFRWLERSYEGRDMMLVWLKWGCMFEIDIPLGDDPRYADLLQRVGLEG